MIRPMYKFHESGLGSSELTNSSPYWLIQIERYQEMEVDYEFRAEEHHATLSQYRRQSHA